MFTLKKVIPFIILAVACFLFYYKYVFFGLVPFPGDLLVSEYQPFRSYSFEGYTPGSVPNKAQYFDSIREFYPWRTLTTDQLKKGQLPLWNPYNFSGTPHLANFQTAVFYPLNAIYLVVNQIDAWSVLILLQPLLASFFTYLYLYKLGLSRLSRIFGSVAYAYSSYMNVWLQFQVVGHTILWLPLILYSLESLLERFSIQNCVLVILSVAFSLFGGHPLDFAVVYIFAFIYLIYRVYKEKKTIPEILKHVFIFVLPLAVGFIQLFPTLNFLSSSTRVMFTYDFFINNLLVPPSQLIMLIAPDFFGNPATRNYWPPNSYVGITLSIGVAPLIVIVTFLFLRKKMLPVVSFLIYCIIAILILTTRNLLTEILYKVQIPVLSTIAPNKLFSIFMFSMAVVSSYSFHTLLENKKLEKSALVKTLLVIGVTLAIAVLEAFFVAQKGFNTALKSILLAASISLGGFALITTSLKFSQVKNVAATALIALLLAEQFYAFQKFNPFIPRAFIFPSTEVLEFLQDNAGINRFWGYGTAKIESNLATQYKLFSTDGFDALNLRWYNEFVRSSNDGRIFTAFTHEERSVAEIAPGYGEEDLPSNHYRLRVLDALGVKYILDRAENPQNTNTFPQDRFKLVWKDEAGWRVYENLNSAPRFFLTNMVMKYSSTQDFEQQFFSDNFNSSSMVLIHESESIPQLCSDIDQNQSTVSLTSYEPTRITFEIDTLCNTFVYLSDTYEQGWKAVIDSKPAYVYKANYAFRGVVVPQGKHTLTFSYSLF